MKHAAEQNPDLLKTLQQEAITLLQDLIRNPSYSGNEEKTAYLISQFLTRRGVTIHHNLNNIWAFNKHYDAGKPTILLNSHHDTVKPNEGYTRAPFEPTIENGRLYGLGSNDAGGPLVSLLATFCYYYDQPGLTYNLVIAATAEEENSGPHGIENTLPSLGKIDLAIVGEPTGMQIGVAEKGLMVIDATVKGRAGHAARREGENAIYKAMQDIQWLQDFAFEKESPTLGPTLATVTVVHAGEQHNTIPDTCQYVIDCRITDAYTHEEVLETLRQNLVAELKPRSMRLKSSGIDPDHVIVQAGKTYGAQPFGSPTLSDQALIPVPSVKIGPGLSERSHTADEFIEVREIEEGIEKYINILGQLLS